MHHMQILNLQMSGMVISTLVTLVPLVDCSSAVGQIEMSEVSFCPGVTEQLPCIL